MKFPGYFVPKIDSQRLLLEVNNYGPNEWFVRLHALMAKLLIITLKSSLIMRRVVTHPIRAKF